MLQAVKCISFSVFLQILANLSFFTLQSLQITHFKCIFSHLRRVNFKIFSNHGGWMKSVLSYLRRLHFKIFSIHGGWIKGIFELFQNTEFQNFLQPWWMNQRRFELFEKWKQKWAEQLDKINFFVYCWKLAHLIFLIFCIKLEGIKGYKLPQMPFLGNFSFCRFWPFLLIFGPKKINFFV